MRVTVVEEKNRVPADWETYGKTYQILARTNRGGFRTDYSPVGFGDWGEGVGREVKPVFSKRVVITLGE